ncbi:MAG: hypothetical protein RL406_1828, partial [Pseudomonadota bacterium]
MRQFLRTKFVAELVRTLLCGLERVLEEFAHLCVLHR